MVINKFGERLYMGLENVIEQHLSTIARKIDAAQGETFLRELKLRWEHHNKSMQMIRDILMVSWSSGRSATEDAQSDRGGWPACCSGGSWAGISRNPARLVQLLGWRTPLRWLGTCLRAVHFAPAQAAHAGVIVTWQCCWKNACDQTPFAGSQGLPELTCQCSAAAHAPLRAS